MKILNIPDDLPLVDTPAVFEYVSTNELFKQKINLTKNTFSFLQEGTKEVHNDYASHSVDSSQFLLMKTGNCLMTERFSNPLNEYKSILFFFSNELLYKILDKYNIKFEKSISNHSAYSFKYDAYIRRFVASLIDINNLSSTIKQNVIHAKLEEILLYLVELNGAEFLHSLISERDHGTQKFIRTVENNQLNNLTVKELAFLSNMSVSTFKRTFEKYFHDTPMKWLQNKRLEHAALLLNSNKRPSEIYYEIGYENLSNFIVAFKAKYGVTPKKFQAI